MDPVAPVGSVSADLANDDATMPFWSPDSEWVAFFARGRLKKVRLDGAAPVDVAEVSLDVNGGTWNKDGTRLFSSGTGGDGLRRVSAEGGGSSFETTLDSERKEMSHRWPQFCPTAGVHSLCAKPVAEVAWHLPRRAWQQSTKLVLPSPVMASSFRPTRCCSSRAAAFRGNSWILMEER